MGQEMSEGVLEFGTTQPYTCTMYRWYRVRFSILAHQFQTRNENCTRLSMGDKVNYRYRAQNKLVTR